MRVHKSIIWAVRVGFAGWITFELLNLSGVLHYTLDFTWLGLVVTSTGIFGIIELVSWGLRKSTGTGLPWPAYVIAYFGTSWDVLGDVVHWYSTYNWYDQAAHFFGGASLGIIAVMVLWRLEFAGKIHLPRWMLNIAALGVANFVGILYELEEYFEDVINFTNRLGSATDTANDIFLNVVGALITIVIASMYVASLQRKKSH